MHTVRPLGEVVTDDGRRRAVDEHTIASATVTLRVMTLGATVRAVELTAPAGRRAAGVPAVNAVLAYDRVGDHMEHGRGWYLGATVGRFANRIGRARFELDGTVHRLGANEGDNHLHGGPVGFDRHVWGVAGIHGDAADGGAVTFRLTSPAGDQGYPGTLHAVVRVAVEGDRIELGYEATTDAPTVVNLTGHAYWNLAGTGDVLDHELQVAADEYVVVDLDKIPTGELAAVDGTALDFRTRRRVGDAVGVAGGIDRCYVLAGAPGVLRPAAVLSHPPSGRWLAVHTDQPGLQVYTGDHLGAPFVRHGGVALEPERFPDAPNHPGFPSAVLRPGETYRHRTELRFGTGAPPAP